MQHLFTSKLNKRQYSDVIELYNSFEVISIEQYPGWAKINNPEKKIVYSLCYDAEKLMGYTVIIEKFKIASVYHGPICNDLNIQIECIIEIYKNCLKKKFAKLIIKPTFLNPIKLTEYEQKLGNKIKFKQNLNNIENWSSLIIDLSKPIVDIRNAYSLNHKRSLKKALGLGLEIKKINSISEIVVFSSIYNNLYKNRNLVKSFKNTINVFSKIWIFFETNKNGDFWGVYKNQMLIGGLVLVKQQNAIFYQYGASDNNYKKIPILHLAFDHAIEYYKKQGFKCFDFGGYQLNVEKTNQIFKINKFKKGFGGETVIYPPNISITVNKGVEIILDYVKKARNKLFR